MQRIGILSGAFDPVHVGHVSFALDAADQANLDKVYFLVEPQPRHKQGVKSSDHRIEMVRRAIGPYANLGLVILEQQRFTVHETLPVLMRRFAGAELFMLMGSDVFKRLSHWHYIEDLVTAAHFIVGVRSHENTAISERLQRIGSTKYLALHYQTFEPRNLTYSSATIRAALRNGKVPAGLPASVVAYIRREGLYMPQDGLSS